MSKAHRTKIKATDEDITRLNSIGLSLGTIGKELGCHPTTITLRLNALNVSPADTRRAFMEGIYQDLSKDQKRWLAEQLGPHISIKDFIKNLLVKMYIASMSKPGDTNDQ
jgi:hypothetical protein